MRNFIAASTAYGVRATSPSQSNAVQRRGMQTSDGTFLDTPRDPRRVASDRGSNGTCGLTISPRNWTEKRLALLSSPSTGKPFSRFQVETSPTPANQAFQFLSRAAAPRRAGVPLGRLSMAPASKATRSGRSPRPAGHDEVKPRAPRSCAAGTRPVSECVP